MLPLHDPVRPDGFPPLVRKERASPSPAAGRPGDERPPREVVQAVDRVPGGLVADADRPGGLRDRTELVDFLQQVDPVAPEIGRVRLAKPERSRDFERSPRRPGLHLPPPSVGSRRSTRNLEATNSPSSLGPRTNAPSTSLAPRSFSGGSHGSPSP